MPRPFPRNHAHSPHAPTTAHIHWLLLCVLLRFIFLFCIPFYFLIFIFFFKGQKFKYIKVMHERFYKIKLPTYVFLI